MWSFTLKIFQHSLNKGFIFCDIQDIRYSEAHKPCHFYLFWVKWIHAGHHQFIYSFWESRPHTLASFYKHFVTYRCQLKKKKSFIIVESVSKSIVCTRCLFDIEMNLHFWLCRRFMYWIPQGVIIAVFTTLRNIANQFNNGCKKFMLSPNS